jgi:hypothetical protein
MKTPWAEVDSFRDNFGSSDLTARRSCPVCGGERSRGVLEFRGFQFFSDEAERPKRADVREVQCSSCFALYLNPCYTDYGFSVLFSEAGLSYGASPVRYEEQRDWLRDRGLIESGGEVLDIGCYEGAFLRGLPGDMRRVGIDIDAKAVERGRRLCHGDDIELMAGDFESFPYGGSPDTIMMFHVLEHLPRPVSVLRRLRAAAGDATLLVVEVPILEKGHTNDINGFFSVQHMTHFSRNSLEGSLLRAGWKIREWSERDDYNGCRVVAEPASPFECPEADSEDVKRLMDYLSSWYASVRDVEEELLPLRSEKRCLIWGGGLHLEFLYQMTSFFLDPADRQYLVIDSDPEKQGKTWRGIPIAAPSVLRSGEGEDAPLVVSSYGSQESIGKAALELGVDGSRIVKLYRHVRRY